MPKGYPETVTCKECGEGWPTDLGLYCPMCGEKLPPLRIRKQKKEVIVEQNSGR